jgi:hypothetical protein
MTSVCTLIGCSQMDSGCPDNPECDILRKLDVTESEVEVIEVPVVKRMVFQFKKPVKLEFDGGPE